MVARTARGFLRPNASASAASMSSGNQSESTFAGSNVAHWRGPLPPKSSACSNQIWISATTRCSTWPQHTAEKSIRRSRLRRPRGRALASPIGGSKTVRSGSDGYEVRTAAGGGSERLIFALREAHSHESSASPPAIRPATSEMRQLSLPAIVRPAVVTVTSRRSTDDAVRSAEFLWVDVSGQADFHP